MCKGCTEADEFGKFVDMDAADIVQACAGIALVIRQYGLDLGDSSVLLVASDYIKFLQGYDTCAGEFTPREWVQIKLQQYGGDLSSYVAVLAGA